MTRQETLILADQLVASGSRDLAPQSPRLSQGDSKSNSTWNAERPKKAKSAIKDVLDLKKNKTERVSKSVAKPLLSSKMTKAFATPIKRKTQPSIKSTKTVAAKTP